MVLGLSFEVINTRNIQIRSILTQIITINGYEEPNVCLHFLFGYLKNTQIQYKLPETGNLNN